MPYKLRNKVRHKFPKAHYKITNWKDYEMGLKNRGNICFWFSEEAIKGWYCNNKIKTVGRQFKYSELAIKTGLILKIVFKLTYRSLEGFLNSISDMLQVNIDIPDHTIFSRRASRIKEIELVKLKSNKKLNVIFDSTGLKIFSEEEWLKEKYNLNKNKPWRKLHLAIDEKTQQIIASNLTPLNISDNAMVKPLLQAIPQRITKVIADKAYDSEQVYADIVEATNNKKVNITISGRPNASKICYFRCNLTKRNIEQRKWFDFGPYKWQKATGYNKRSLVETAIMRYKQLIGAKLFSRNFVNQKVESLLSSLVLNRMLTLGSPISIRV